MNSNVKTAPLVLAIDDNPSILDLLEILLTDSGLRFVGAESAVKGLKIIQDEEPALILLDIQLPRLGGLEFLRILRTKDAPLTTPVLIISDIEDKLRHQMEALRLGAERYFSKPFDNSELVAAIHAHIESPPATAFGRSPSDSELEATEDRLQNVFQGFKIRGILGAGGMATVYRAIQLNPEGEEGPGAESREVALKVLLRCHAVSDHHVQRFQREAEILKSIDHPNIVRVYETGFNDPFHYIAMEIVEGKSVLRLIEEGAIAPERFAHFVRQMSEPLIFLHGEGIVHRDVKPANYLEDASGRIKLADFGLVGGAELSRMTADEAALGSFAYMSPEQKADASKADARADVYSLAVSFYEMVTGRLPNMRGRIVIQCEDRFAPVFERGLEANPNNRYQSIEELRDGMLAALGE